MHGVVYDGTADNQKPVELKLDGDKLTFRYYDGPTLELMRVKVP
jgi:hypothetical protein